METLRWLQSPKCQSFSWFLPRTSYSLLLLLSIRLHHLFNYLPGQAIQPDSCEPWRHPQDRDYYSAWTVRVRCYDVRIKDLKRFCCGQPPSLCTLQYGSKLITEIDIGGDKQDTMREFNDRLTMLDYSDVFHLAGVVTYKGCYTKSSVGYYVASISKVALPVCYTTTPGLDTNPSILMRTYMYKEMGEIFECYRNCSPIFSVFIIIQ